MQPRFPGRPDFPIDGPPSFVEAVERVLSTLRRYHPEAHTQTLEYLPRAVYNPQLLNPDPKARVHVNANAAGFFALDGTGDFDYFLHVFLHEVAHCIRSDIDRDIPPNIKENEADRYAAFAILHIERAKAEEERERQAEQLKQRLAQQTAEWEAKLASASQTERDRWARERQESERLLERAVDAYKHDMTKALQFLGERQDLINRLLGERTELEGELLKAQMAVDEEASRRAAKVAQLKNGEIARLQAELNAAQATLARQQTTPPPAPKPARRWKETLWADVWEAEEYIGYALILAGMVSLFITTPLAVVLHWSNAASLASLLSSFASPPSQRT